LSIFSLAQSLIEKGSYSENELPFMVEDGSMKINFDVVSKDIITHIFH